MALSHELPIYRETFDLLKLLIQVTRNIPRDYKRLVGEELRNECIKITVAIFRANVATHKAPQIQEIRERLQVVELMLRMSQDLRWIAPKQYGALVKLTQSIGRQATGWLHSSKPKPSPAG